MFLGQCCQFIVTYSSLFISFITCCFYIVRTEWVSCDSHFIYSSCHSDLIYSSHDSRLMIPILFRPIHLAIHISFIHLAIHISLFIVIPISFIHLAIHILFIQFVIHIFISCANCNFDEWFHLNMWYIHIHLSLSLLPFILLVVFFFFSRVLSSWVFCSLEYII